jgi:hypothetical protein
VSPDIAASVRARLLAKAKERREEFERTLTRFAAERWLYRLGISEARDRCVLKGASLVAAWLPEPYRVTRDIDMLARGPADEAAIRGLVETVCAVPCPEDGLRFDLSGLTLEPIRPDEEYVGTRARFVAFLAKARIRVQLDFGVGDALTADPEEIDYPTILASLPCPRVRAYPREASVAEKFQAMVALDDRNSRMKDFHDLWVLSGALSFDGAALGRAISACFARRQTALTPEAPGCLTPAFYQDAALAARWRSYLASSAVLVRPPAQFDTIGERISGFIGPVRRRIVDGLAPSGTWPPGGPWR